MPNSVCIPRDVLKKYLVGVFDERSSVEIESHLASCLACEKTIVSLDSDPDTLVESLREVGASATDQREGLDSSPCELETPSVIMRAVASARQFFEPKALNSMLPLSLSRIGAYDLIKPLGRGGMGIVVLARHRSLQKDVAIKVLTSLAGDRTDLVIRFQREMRTAGLLNHPAIVNATDAGQELGNHYLVMEYVDGLDLSRIARLTGILAIADACEIARQVALGLSHAHSVGVVHRDIKPSNLMIDASARVKILDFGLAQINNWDEAACELTTVGQLMGTLDYMAPEQAERSGSVDFRADLYALGATLFRLLAGRAPLATAPNMTLLDKVRMLGTETAPSLTNFRTDCPSALVELVKQMLRRDPSQRPSSAAHIAESLEPFCNGHQLVGLVTRAQAVAAQVVADEPLQIAPQQPPSLQYTTQPNAKLPPRRMWPWVLCALVPFVAWAGIVITLETQKGQLVIQSEVADVHIQLAKDGKLVNEITVQPGAQSTRLRADKYEIRIDSPSDQVGLDIDRFSIKNGETIVATIKRTEKAKELSLEQYLDRAQVLEYSENQPSTLPAINPGEGRGSKQETAGTEPSHAGVFPPTHVPDRNKTMEDYKLMVGDEVILDSIFDGNIKQTRVQVQADGSIVVPMLKSPLQAAGKNIQTLRKDLELAYKEYIRSPAIDLSPVKVNPTPPSEPKEVVKLFLDAMRAGNGAKLSSFLSKLAQEELKRNQLEITPLGTPNAVFKIDDAIKQDEDSVLVSSSWTEPEQAGKPATKLEIVWELRNEPEGWKICGMAVDPLNGDEVQIVDFERSEPEQAAMQRLKKRTSPPTNADPSLDEWLAGLERNLNIAEHWRGEVESQFQSRALVRIAELTQSDRAEEVSQRLLTIAKNADVSLWSDVDQILTPARGQGNRPTLDVLLLDCFRQIQTKENFQQFFESQLLTGDDRWTSRWFAVLLKLVGNDGNGRYHFSPDDVFISKLLTTDGLDRYGQKSVELAFAFLLRSLLTNKSFAEKHASSLINAANSHPSLGRTASLSIDCRLDGKFNRSTRTILAEGEIEVEKEVARFAKQVFLSTQSTPQELALAAGRLATTTEIVYEWRPSLVEELRTRLKVLAATPFRSSALLENRYGAFIYSQSSGLQNFPSTNIFIESKVRGRAGLNMPRYISSEAISCIALAKRLSATEALNDELSQLMKSTQESYVKVAIKLRMEPPIQLTWEARAKSNFLDPDSPISWWPFEEAVLKSMGSTYNNVPQSDWIRWAVFGELCSAIPNEQSPLLHSSNAAMAEVDLKIADKDEDGKVSQTELSSLPELPAGKLYQDLDGDGFIDKNEIVAARYAGLK